MAIPLAELPTTEGVYVIHLSEPLAHARGYTGWALNIARRVAEHLDVKACRAAGSHLSADACRRAGGCQHRTHHAGSPRPPKPCRASPFGSSISGCLPRTPLHATRSR
jgi:hypothetical protein